MGPVILILKSINLLQLKLTVSCYSSSMRRTTNFRSATYRKYNGGPIIL